MERFPGSLGRGFQEGGVKYGLPLHHLEMRSVNGIIYQRQVMVGEPENPKGPPPAVIFYLLSRLHPEMRRRNKAWFNSIENRQWEKDLEDWDVNYKPDSIRRNLALAEVDVAALSDAEFNDHLRACSENLGEMFYRHHRYTVSCMLPTGRAIAIATASGDVTAAEVIALLRGSTPVSAGAFAEEMSPLVNAITASGASAESLEGIADDDFCDHLRGLGASVAAALDRYLLFAGVSIVSGYTILEKTLREMPGLLKSRILDALRRAGEDTKKVNVEEVEAMIAAVRAKVPEQRRSEFDSWLAVARQINRLRDERGVYNDSWANGISRIAVLEAGRRLVARGILADAELALDASAQELIDMMSNRNVECAGELAARRDHRLNTRLEDAPAWLGNPPGGPPPLDLMPAGLRQATETVLAALSNVFDDEEVEEVDTESDAILTLKGLPVSPGSFEGTARVIGGPDDFHRIQQGDVLVTRNTSASFNVVLPKLGGLITDRGGLLSHAAIVSREYGIPGVVSTKRATLDIPDGSRVRIDGSAGTVSVLS